MHFDVFSCTNIIIIIISYSFGFSYCQPNISHSKFSWVLKQSLYLWFSRGIVFCAMDILLLDYFPMLGHSDFAPTFPCSGKHPCNRFLRTNSWSPRARKIWSHWCRLGTHWRQGQSHWSVFWIKELVSALQLDNPTFHCDTSQTLSGGYQVQHKSPQQWNKGKDKQEIHLITSKHLSVQGDSAAARTTHTAHPPHPVLHWYSHTGHLKYRNASIWVGKESVAQAYWVPLSP